MNKYNKEGFSILIEQIPNSEDNAPIVKADARELGERIAKFIERHTNPDGDFRLKLSFNSCDESVNAMEIVMQLNTNIAVNNGKDFSINYWI